MRYEKIGTIIRRATPAERPAKFTPEQIEKFKTVGAVALGIIGTLGVVALTILAPNIFVAVNKLFLEKHPNRRFSKKEKDIKVAQTFYYLKRSGLIIMKPIGSDIKIFLTKLGKKRLNQLNFHSLSVPKPRKWNGKWWQVAADIPTKEHRIGADLFRKKLKNMKFYPLQRTLWFHPYDPRDQIELIAEHYGIARFVTVMEISRLDLDDLMRMKEYFKNERIL